MSYLNKLNEEDLKMLAGDVARFIVLGWYDTTGTDDRSIDISDDIRREYLEYLNDEKEKAQPYFEYLFGVTHKHKEDTLKEDFEAAKEECELLRPMKSFICINQMPVPEYATERLWELAQKFNEFEKTGDIGTDTVLVLKVSPTEDYPDGYYYFLGCR